MSGEPWRVQPSHGCFVPRSGLPPRSWLACPEVVITWTAGATSQSVGVRGKHVSSAPVSLGDEPKGLRVHKGNTRPSAVPDMAYAMPAQAGFLVTPTVGPSVMGVVWLDRKPSWCAPGIRPGFSEQHGADLVILVSPGSCLFLSLGLHPASCTKLCLNGSGPQYPHF